MTDHQGLRNALAGLAVADAPAPVATADVLGRAAGIRRRRRAGAALACAAFAVVVAGLGRPAAHHDGLVGVTPSTSPTPSSHATTVNAPRPSATVAPEAAGSPVATAGPSGPAAASPAVTESPPVAGEPPVAPASPAPATPLPNKLTPVCNLVVDQTGDTETASQPQLDIVSADVASGETEVAAVLRVDDLGGDTLGNPVTWTVGWTLGGATYTFESARGANGPVATRLVVVRDGATTVATATATFYASSGQIRWTTARSNVPDLATSTTFSGINAATSRGTAPTTTPADSASTTQTYEDKTRSCVKPG